MPVARGDGAGGHDEPWPGNLPGLDLLPHRDVQPVLLAHDPGGRHAGAEGAAEVADGANGLALNRTALLPRLVAQTRDDRHVGVGIDEAGHEELVRPLVHIGSGRDADLRGRARGHDAVVLDQQHPIPDRGAPRAIPQPPGTDCRRRHTPVLLPRSPLHEADSKWCSAFPDGPVSHSRADGGPEADGGREPGKWARV